MFVFCHFSSLFSFLFLCFYLFFIVLLYFFPLFSENKGKQLQFTGKMGNFTPTPSAPTPCQTSREMSAEYPWGDFGETCLRRLVDPGSSGPKTSKRKSRERTKGVIAKVSGCKLPWPFFSRKPPALTSINRRKSAINPEIASTNVC